MLEIRGDKCESVARRVDCEVLNRARSLVRQAVVLADAQLLQLFCHAWSQTLLLHIDERGVDAAIL